MLSQLNYKEYTRKTALYLCLLSAVAVFFVVPLTVRAQSFTDPNQQSGFADTGGLEDETLIDPQTGINLDTQTDLRIFIARIINVFLGFLGIILLGLIVYGGWLYMTSQGDVEKTTKAKAILKNAVIGLLIILASWSIAYFILRALFDGEGGAGTTRPRGYDVGVGALGDGIIQSHYPERGARDVPRNTAIIITFKEAMSLASICTGDSPASPCDLDSDTMKIFATSQGIELDEEDANAKQFAAGAVVLTTDYKTFVLRPKSYLGSQSANQWYGVRLTEGGLRRASNNEVVDLGIAGFYQWKFEVSTRLDLEPPQISSTFPHPDNSKDEVSPAQGAVKAVGTITVNNVPRAYAPVSVAVIPSDVEIVAQDYQCEYKGAVTFTRSTGEGLNDALILASNAPATTGFLQAANITNNSVSIGCGISLDVTNVAVGVSVTVTVAPEQTADWIIVGSKRYVFGEDIAVNAGEAGYVVAGRVRETLDGNSQVTAAISGPPNVVTLSAKAAGTAGNAIALSSNAPATIISLSGANLTGGREAETKVEKRGLKDEPRNAVIQINFNEAMNPLQLQGDAENIKNYVQVRCITSDSFSCDPTDYNYITTDSSGNKYIKGEFMASNVYRTVEFLSTAQSCGENMCGDPRYCLPGNANIQVWTKAAGLLSCDNDADNGVECNAQAGNFGAYPTCTAGVCNNSEQNNPQASAALDGAMDAAFNSLDGNKNNNAEGPWGDFNENNSDEREDETDRLFGDNYKWSFWISDKIDDTSPKVSSAKQVNFDLVKVENNQGQQVLGADTSTASPLGILFDKIMMSASLKPGRNYPDDFYLTPDQNERVPKEYFVFAKFSGRPLGYWIKKADEAFENGYAQKTRAIVEHTEFENDAAYGFVSGSGLKDIYQNCYNPAADAGQGGSNCKELKDGGTSCCKGNALANGDADGDGKKDLCYRFE